MRKSLRFGNRGSRLVALVGLPCHHLADNRSQARGQVIPQGLQRWRLTLLVQEEIDSERVDLRQEGDEILQRSAETIDGPGHDDRMRVVRYVLWRR